MRGDLENLMYHTEITEFIVAKYLKIKFDSSFLEKNISHFLVFSVMTGAVMKESFTKINRLNLFLQDNSDLLTMSEKVIGFQKN